jgi:CRP-like cAMP-binding protein
MLPMPKLEQWSSPKNRLLASLSVREYERLLPHFESISLGYRDRLQESGVPIKHVYFLNDAIVALLSVVERNATIEVGIIGNEGMVGAPILLGSQTTPTQAIVQSPGTAMRLPGEILKQELKRSGTMQDLLLPYAHAQLAEGNQSAACHRYHTPRERLSRWLLMVRDRSETDELKITHDFISQMLGTRRATVTEAVHVLQKKGLIKSSRGRILILNRQGLEATACSCYATIRAQFAALKYS